MLINLDEELIDKDFAGCHITKKMGAGGMGAVYQAHHLRLDRYVCVKVLPPHMAGDERNVQFFLREARSAAKLNSPNIVQIFDVGNENGIYYIMMSYIDGKSLSEIVEDSGPIPLKEALEIFKGILLGLKTAHEKTVIHRDIKPSNILVDSAGVPKIVDFGLARKVEEDKQLTLAGEMVGTAYFMSPEQGLGKHVDHRADLYSAGVTLFYILTGKNLFNGSTSMEVIQKHLSDEPPTLIQVAPIMPSWVSDMISKLVKKKPEERYQSAREVLSVLETKEANYNRDASDKRKSSSDKRIPAASMPSLNLDSDDVLPVATVENKREKVLSYASIKEKEAVVKAEKTEPGLAEDVYIKQNVDEEKETSGWYKRQYVSKKQVFLSSAGAIAASVLGFILAFALGSFSSALSPLSGFERMFVALFDTLFKIPVFSVIALALTLAAVFFAMKTMNIAKVLLYPFALLNAYYFGLFGIKGQPLTNAIAESFAAISKNFISPNSLLITAAASLFLALLYVLTKKTKRLVFINAIALPAGLLSIYKFTSCNLGHINGKPLIILGAVSLVLGLAALLMLVIRKSKRFIRVIYFMFFFASFMCMWGYGVSEYADHAYNARQTEEITPTDVETLYADSWFAAFQAPFSRINETAESSSVYGSISIIALILFTIYLGISIRNRETLIS